MIETEYNISNIEKIRFDLETQFHILKHFATVDNLYMQLLINQTSYNEANILKQFDEVGSKFHFNFAKNPANLIATLIKEIKIKNIQFEWQNNRCELHIEYSLTEFPYGIGVDCLFPINELSEIEKKQINKINRSGVLVNVLQKKPLSTLKINLILIKIDNEIKVISVFPGIYAPVLPNIITQNEAQYSNSIQFWDNYVFLIHKTE